ncbi:17583_t:CDS:1, partial [Funneliformis geosporum]
KNKTEINIQDEILSSDDEYYSADEGPEFDRYCYTCKQSFKYPYILKRHHQMK